MAVMTFSPATVLALIPLLIASVSARTYLTGCTSTDESSPAGASVAWYVPGTGEICSFLDCGGGTAPPITTQPGCPLYSGTATYSPSYLAGYGSATAAPSAASSSAASSSSVVSLSSSSSSSSSAQATVVVVSSSFSTAVSSSSGAGQSSTSSQTTLVVSSSGAPSTIVASTTLITFAPSLINGTAVTSFTPAGTAGSSSGSATGSSGNTTVGTSSPTASATPIQGNGAGAGSVIGTGAALLSGVCAVFALL